MLAANRDEFDRYQGVLIESVIQRVLMLCSSEPDVSDRAKPTSAPSRAGKSKDKWKEARTLVDWTVGDRLSARWKELAERKEDGDSNGNRLQRPFKRRAHWHLYWTGKGRHKPKVRWLAPVLVNDRGDELPVTEHRSSLDEVDESGESQQF